MTKTLTTLTLASCLSVAISASALADMPGSFADLVEEIQPAVVNITTTTTVEGQPLNFQIPNQDQLPEIFRRFFEEMPNQLPNQGLSEPHEAQALGSGYVIDEEGIIITNNHVIDGADEIAVEFTDGTILNAEVVGTDMRTDVAVLRVKPDAKLPSVQFGDSEEVRVGDWVVAVGNPLGQGFSVSAGIVSARNRSLQGTFDDFIQTDAAINRGNSGGPLFNLDGEVVGMNTAILSPDGGSIGIGFAMSSRVVEKIVDQILEYGEARRGYLGVELIQEVNQEYADAMGLDKAIGVLVQPSSDGPAEAAGLVSGDAILAVNGEEIESFQELAKIVGNSNVGEKVVLTVYRFSTQETLDIEVELVARPNEQVLAQNQEEAVDENTHSLLGLSLVELNADNAASYGVEASEGLLVTALDNQQQNSESMIIEGDIIIQFNGVNTPDFASLEAAVNDLQSKGQKSGIAAVLRGQEMRFIVLPIE